MYVVFQVPRLCPERVENPEYRRMQQTYTVRTSCSLFFLFLFFFLVILL